jgi:hypothetical protein
MNEFGEKEIYTFDLEEYEKLQYNIGINFNVEDKECLNIVVKTFKQ